MSVFDRLEKGIEGVLNTAFAKTFRSGTKPVDVAQGLRHVIDKQATGFSLDRTVAPNVFDIHLAKEVYEDFSQMGLDALRQEFERVATQYGTEQNYVFLGPVQVNLHSSLVEKTFQIQTSSTPGAGAPVAPTQIGPTDAVLEVGEQRFSLAAPRVVVGRSRSCDIVIDDPGLSRQHFEIKQVHGAFVMQDLGSTNGTYVEGHKVPAATLLDGNQIEAGRTSFMFWAPSQNQEGS